MGSTHTYFGQQAVPIGEAARMLGVSIPTIRNWERAGKIAAIRTPGNQRRIPVAEVQRLLGGEAVAS